MFVLTNKYRQKHKISVKNVIFVHFLLSLPTRGVWIEIANDNRPYLSTDSRSPHGECGLKSSNVATNAEPG